MIKQGDKIYYYKINIKESGKTTYEEEVLEVAVAKDSEIFGRLMIINDDFYTRIQTKKEKYTANNILNAIRCHEWNWAVTEDELDCYVYTTCSDANKMKAKMYKEIEKYSQKKGKKYQVYINKSNEMKGE